VADGNLLEHWVIALTSRLSAEATPPVTT
jgi:hypothetical protein